MNSFASPFLRELHDRGFIYQGTDLKELDKKAAVHSLVLYIGYDATAHSLHVGNLMTMMVARIAQRQGHKVLILMGGGTTLVGDPSGKDQTRQMLSEEKIAENISNIQKCYHKFIDFSTDKGELVNNADWLKSLKYLDFLRDYGPHFTINRMLGFESVRLRLEREQPLTFLEFNYMLLQSFDFLHLAQTFGCDLQVGGADQWGNIVSGVDLVRRIAHKEVFGLTIPLITMASGAKMGKSVHGAVWLDSNPFDYWQFWRNTEDADVLRFLKYYTDLPVQEIESYQGVTGAELNPLKRRLADEATAMAYGKEVLPEIHKTVGHLFGGGDLKVSETIPTFKINPADRSLIGSLVETGLCASRGEARRLIRGGGAYVDLVKVTDESLILPPLKEGEVIQLAAGRKKHVQVIYA